MIETTIYVFGVIAILSICLLIIAVCNFMAWEWMWKDQPTDWYYFVAWTVAKRSRSWTDKEKRNAISAIRKMADKIERDLDDPDQDK